MVLMCNWKPA